MIPADASVEELAGGEWYRLHRVSPKGGAAPLLIKTPRHDPPLAVELAALRRETHLLARLETAGTLRPVPFDGAQSPVLALPDPGGQPLAACTRPAELAMCLAIGSRLASVLADLHAAGITHNALRPEAILTSSDGARVCLLDVSEAGSTPAQPAATSPRRLIYAAPEQTGRIMLAPDHRSDLYSLGVIVYELLTGAPPFVSGDALELMHWHVAKTAAPPSRLDARIPQAVSEIVMKLLAKTPDERYRSARGVRHDLERCAREWAAHGRIDPFAIAQHDVHDQFRVSQRLYGRESDIRTLLQAFERTCEKPALPSALLLVSGESGIGKTALIRELFGPIVRRRGHFISGKFDQVVRSTPFAALIQAFSALVRQLLTESEGRLRELRAALERALGANGGVLSEVIPELEYIIGKQPAPVALGPTEALNRFQLVFRNFVAALARPEHPLVVFLDDLQWADPATLGLLEPLLAGEKIGCLLVIGAHRDDESLAEHRLAGTLAALEAGGVLLHRVSLRALGECDIAQLLRDTLACDEASSSPLARQVLAKTGGNPFVVTQYLQALYEDGYFTLDAARGRWQWQVQAIAQAPYTENVIDLMTRRIERLPERTRRLLTLAACIGARFDETTLALVSEEASDAVARGLAQAQDEGLIVASAASTSTAPAYAFLHDRVQQQAYARIPEGRRKAVHLAVGRRIRSLATAQGAEDNPFEIVHHLNLGRELVEGDAERTGIANLNLCAGRKAKDSAAHDAARHYFEQGLACLSDAHWKSHYALAFELHLEAAEAHYLCGEFDASERMFETMAQHAATDLDRARMLRLRGVQCENMARYADALAYARAALGLFGVLFPYAAAEKEAALEAEIASIETLQAGRTIASLIELPVMADAQTRMVMNILTDIWATTYILGDPTLARLISATMVRLSLAHGNVEESAYGYVTHAITVGSGREDYAQAYEFGLLALAVNSRFGDTRRRAKIQQQFHAHVNFFRQPLASCLAYAREACRSGLESGDFLYAAYGASTETWPAILSTRDLAQFEADYAPRIALVRRLKNTGFADSMQLIVNWARALRGETASPLSLSDASLDEAAYSQTYSGNAFFTCFHAVAKLQLCYLHESHAEAGAAALVAKANAHQLAGTVWPIASDFWMALALARTLHDAPADEQAARLAELRRVQRSHRVLADNCPENYLCQWLLISAEIERACGDAQAALPLYEQAMQAAGEARSLSDAALANELAAKFRLARGHSRAAALFMREARACWAAWGAAAKVAQLDAAYPELLAAREPSSIGSASHGDAEPASKHHASALESLDLLSVVKAAKAIADEIELEQVLDKLMHIAIENAGAQQGSLLLEHDGAPSVHAHGSLDAVRVNVRSGEPLSECRGVLRGVVHYVRRTLESVLLDDAANDERYGAEAALRPDVPRSVMCLPVLMQGKLVAVLYLENNAVAGAFTAERLRIVQILATEAAISLVNAQLVDGLKQEIAERTKAQDDLRAALAKVEELSRELEAENTYLRRDMIAGVSHDLRTPLASLRGFLETLRMNDASLGAAERREYLDIAVHQSVHLSRLVNQLFELAKLDWKGIELELEPLQLKELAHDVVQKLHLDAAKRKLRLRVDAPDALPMVQADVGMMERVFENLLENALKYVPRGRDVCIELRPDGARVCVRVADTGNGIASSELPAIFERYHRAEKSRPGANDGAGLGLAITKRILELHGSEIGVESSAGAGTCFTFALPALLRGGT